MKVVFDHLPDVLSALWTTVQLAVLSFLGALVVGTVVAILRISPVAPLRAAGLPYWPYDPSLRFHVRLLAPVRAQTLNVPIPDEAPVALRLVGHVELPLPAPITTVAATSVRLDVWWLHQYGGGVFIPLRDGTAGRSSYGGGRYLLDTAKGAWLGGDAHSIVLDLNFAYHPSCRYDPRWTCPLAPPGNTVSAPVEAGERL